MSAPSIAKSSVLPAALGWGSVAIFIAAIEGLIRAGLINRFIVPMPSEVLLAFPRIVSEENVLSRFVLTVAEAFSASILVAVFGIAGGVLLHRFNLLRQATETWVAAVAAAPLVLIYPLYLVIFGRSFNLTPAQQFWKILFPSALPTIFVGLRLGLIFALINIVGVEFLINFGGLGQLINELAERYDLAGTYAAICFVVLVSVCVFVLMERLERWLRPVD